MKDGDFELAPPRRAPWRIAKARFGLRTRIAALLAVIVFALAFSLATLIGAATEQQARDRLGGGLASDADRLAERLNKEMAARAREIELVSALGALRNLQAGGDVAGPDISDIRGLLDGLKRSFPAYVWIGVTDPDGKVRAATGGVLEGANVSARASFQDVLTARGNDITSDATQQARSLLPNDTMRVIDIVHPVLGVHNTVVAVVFAQLSWNWLDATAAAVLSPNPDDPTPREAYLVSSENRIVLGPGDTLGATLTLPDIARARAGYPGWSVEDWPDGERYLTGAAYAAGEGAYPGPGSQRMQWTVLVREPVALAFMPANQLRNDIVLAGLVLAAIFALLGWLMAVWVSAPLARMAAAAERLRQGDDVEMPLLRGAFEIESLSVSLRALVASLTRKQLALEEMEVLTERDPLTGLLNRNGLRKYLDRAARRAHATGHSLMVFIGDLDGFKLVNDQHGHGAGDTVLCEVAARLQSCVRQHDAIARFGGDEFVMVLEASSPGDDEAMRIVRRVAEVISVPYTIGRQTVRVGCSFGGAAWPQDAPSIDIVIEQADAALYAVKRAGKGRLALHSAR